MIQRLIISLVSLSFACISAQVGINTTAPGATLDVVAKEKSGNSAKVEGFLLPRLDRQRAQSMDLSTIPESTVIYVQDVSTGTQTGIAANIDTIGYYFFNGSVWIKLNNSLYTSDGTVSAASGTRTISTGGNTINFQNGNNNIAIASGITANPNEGKITIDGSSKGSLEIAGGSGIDSSAIEIFSDSNSSQIVANGASKNLSISTLSTDPAPIILKTNDVNRLIVSGNGNVSIGNPAADVPAQTIHIEGTARITGSSGTPTAIAGRNENGDIANVSVGKGLSLSQGTLSVGATHISFLSIRPNDNGMYILDSQNYPNHTIWNSNANSSGTCDILLPHPSTMSGRTLQLLAASGQFDVCTEVSSTPLSIENNTTIGSIPKGKRATIQATSALGGMWVVITKDF